MAESARMPPSIRDKNADVKLIDLDSWTLEVYYDPDAAAADIGA